MLRDGHAGIPNLSGGNNNNITKFIYNQVISIQHKTNIAVIAKSEKA